MATDLTVILENRPGTLADIGEALGNAGINIEGMCGFPCEGKGRLHILVEDGAAARRVLKDAGIQITEERKVIVLDIDDRPGAFGSVARKIADEIAANYFDNFSGIIFITPVEVLYAHSL